MLLLLKLTLAPLLVAAATLVARRWGPRVGGLVVGLPLTTGPIFLFLAIDQGPGFAARATVGILFGLVGLAAFALAYAAASRRAGWATSLVLAAVAFFAASAGMGRLGGGVIEAGLAAWAALTLAASLIRRPGPGVARAPPPWWDLWVRMLAAAALTLGITAAAGRLGPVLSGIVGTYPVVSTVVTTFTHAQLGREAAVAMLQGSVLSWIAFASCFLAIGLALEAQGLAVAFALGVLAAVATTVLVLWADRRVASGFSFENRAMLYDNTALAVARVPGDGARQRTRAFAELQSHFLFADRFGRPGKGNDKGKVEGLVGYARRNFLVPVPQVESLAALNAQLEARCRERQGARLRGHDEAIGERLARDRAAMLPLPAAPYEACETRGARVSSLSLVRYRGNDYSVPVAYGHREVLVRGYVEAVVIACGAEVIARHRRSYEREDVVLEPLHYLPLLERKVGALDQAAPLAGWAPPEVFLVLRRLLETRLGKAGRREWVQVLRLLEAFSLEEVQAGVGEALRLGAIGFDAVKHLVLCRIERRPPRLDLEVYPYLPRARVATTSARAYLDLLVEGRP